jgi:TonB family protein
MRSGRIIAVLAALCLCSSQATGQVVQPTGKWVVDYATTQCTASRDFAGPDSPIKFGIIPMPNEQGYDVLFLIRNDFGPVPTIELPGLIGFGGIADSPIKIWVINFRTQPKQSAYQVHLTADQMAKARSATSIWLRVSANRFNVTIPLGSVGNVLQVLHGCVLDLRRYWNTDGEKDGRIAVPSKGDVRSVFSNKDYPEEAFDRNQEGEAQYLLLVDEAGNVAGCQVVQASGVLPLDVMGCQVIKKRAKFQPALDAKGKPVRSTFTTPPVVWRMEP